MATDYSEYDDKDNAKSDLRTNIGTIMAQIKHTSNELVRCKVYLIFWTHVSNGMVEGPRLSELSTRVVGKFRAGGYLPPDYVDQLTSELEALPHSVLRTNLDVFRNL
jgi:hypothetical protein